MSHINVWHHLQVIELKLLIYTPCHTSPRARGIYVMSRINVWHDAFAYVTCHASMSVAHMTESCHVDRVMSHIELSHGTHMDESFHTHERDWGRSRARGEDIVSPGTESCHIWLSYNERVKSHKWIKPEEIESKRGRDLIAVAHNHQIIICCVCVHVHVARIKESCRT